jgi:hypothetical protein
VLRRPTRGGPVGHAASPECACQKRTPFMVGYPCQATVEQQGWKGIGSRRARPGRGDLECIYRLCLSQVACDEPVSFTDAIPIASIVRLGYSIYKAGLSLLRCRQSRYGLQVGFYKGSCVFRQIIVRSVFRLSIAMFFGWIAKQHNLSQAMRKIFKARSGRRG